MKICGESKRRFWGSYETSTASFWRFKLPVREVSVIVSCRAQYDILGATRNLKLKCTNETKRGMFFSIEIFQDLSFHLDSFRWLMNGYFNCVLSPSDVKQETVKKTKKQLFELVRAIKILGVFRYLLNLPRHKKKIKSVVNIAYCKVLLGMRFPRYDRRATRQTRETYWKVNTRILQDVDFQENF